MHTYFCFSKWEFGTILSRESPFLQKDVGCLLKLCLPPGGWCHARQPLLETREEGECLGTVPLSDKRNLCYSWCCQTLKNNLESNWRINSGDQRQIKETVKSPACCVNLQILFGVSTLQSPTYSPLLRHRASWGSRGGRHYYTSLF